MNKMRLSAVIFIGKIWSKSFNNGTLYNRVAFECICATFSRQYTELLYRLFTGGTESGRSLGGCNFAIILPINVPKCHGGNGYVFWQKTFKVVKILLSGTWSLPFHYGYCWNHEHSLSRKTQSQRTWDMFSVEMLAMNLEWCREEKNLTNQNLRTTSSANTLSWYTRTWFTTISMVTQKPIWCVAFFSLQSSKLEKLHLLDSTRTIRQLATCNSD